MTLVRRFPTAVLTSLLVGLGCLSLRATAEDGMLKIAIIDVESTKPVPAHAVIRKESNQPGKASKPIKLAKTAPDGVGLALPQELEIKLSDGVYTFQFDRGPEYRIINGNFQLTRDATGFEEVKLHRFVDMAKEGWLSGDTLVQHAAKNLPLLMDANDLHYAAVPSSSDKDPGDEKLSSTVRRDVWLSPAAPGLLAIGGKKPADLGKHEHSAAFIREAVRGEAEGIIVLNPADWDLPIWLASGKVRAIAVLHPEVRLDRPGKIVGRDPVDPGFLNQTGPGRWAERVWWYMLDAGFEIPAVGASGAAPTGNPTGYNRVYVHSVDTDQPNSFWEHLWRGDSVVTNGPMMRPNLDRHLPGTRIPLRTGQSVHLAPDLKLAVRDRVSYIEVVHNRRAVWSARLDEAAERGVKTSPIEFKENGWAIVRVVTGVEDHFRAAISNPWWFQEAGAPRISRSACEFFQKWLEERAEQLSKESQNASQPQHRSSVRLAHFGNSVSLKPTPIDRHRSYAPAANHIKLGG